MDQQVNKWKMVYFLLTNIREQMSKICDIFKNQNLPIDCGESI